MWTRRYATTGRFPEAKRRGGALTARTKRRTWAVTVGRITVAVWVWPRKMPTEPFGSADV